MVYATCSLLKEENEDVVDAFLQAHPAFRRVPVAEVWNTVIDGSESPGEGPDLHLTPARHGTDGFFVALLEKSVADAAD